MADNNRDPHERVHRIGRERMKYITAGVPDRKKIRVTCKAIAIECMGLHIRFNVRDNGTTEFFLSRGTEERKDLAIRLIHERLKGRPAPDVPVPVVGPLTAANVQTHNENITEKRQFACEPCQKVWWRRQVFTYKPVSRCNKCRVRYDPIPRGREYGWGHYRCERCANVFTGRAQAGVAAPCFRCARENIESMCMPYDIGERPERPDDDRPPPRNNRPRHSCERCDFGRIRPCPAFSPVLFASVPHESTGSTVSTFLTQQTVTDIVDGDSDED